MQHAVCCGCYLTLLPCLALAPPAGSSAKPKKYRPTSIEAQYAILATRRQQGRKLYNAARRVLRDGGVPPYFLEGDLPKLLGPLVVSLNAKQAKGRARQPIIQVGHQWQTAIRPAVLIALLSSPVLRRCFSAAAAAAGCLWLQEYEASLSPEQREALKALLDMLRTKAEQHLAQQAAALPQAVEPEASHSTSGTETSSDLEDPPSAMKRAVGCCLYCQRLPFSLCHQLAAWH